MTPTELGEDEMANQELNKMNECYKCKNRRSVPGNAHIKCANPDPEMEGEEYGRQNGWFYYPSCFDPTWKKKMCANFDPDEDKIEQ